MTSKQAAADTSSWAGSTKPEFLKLVPHRLWLLGQAGDLFGFFQYTSINPRGGFYDLDTVGRPLAETQGHEDVRQLHVTTRMVHCFAIAHLLGRPGADRLIDQGMDFLWKGHRDSDNGGYVWGISEDGISNSTKQAYGHAFVLLAGASAKVVGHPDADRLLEDVSTVLDDRFWDDGVGATTEEYAQDWAPISDYRGQNSNMHLTEALMAAYEATGDGEYLNRAGRIADLIINRNARAVDWRVAEHFDANWNVDLHYAGDPVFRPSGTTPGHALEWSRLLIQLWELEGRKSDWMPEAARNLFHNACVQGWDPQTGGFYYTLDWNNAPDQSDRFWWPCCEGIAAAAVLGQVFPDEGFETWYRRIWSFTDTHLIDRKNGGWFPALDDNLLPTERVFVGKPDIYHAVQACLIPLCPTSGSITRGLAQAGDGLVTG
ncbi:AGE family epimerase/isomerase [Amaricoccus tamworthensis]|uniref:AGE family epimerase/isomerase n=1 Tax=Amaricoccus tamworthensis TaxID=57002 RepID=UPI003C79D2F4